MTMSLRPLPEGQELVSPQAQDDTAPQPDVPLHDARALVGPGQTAQIALDGMVYTLRITRAGKLILTK